MKCRYKVTFNVGPSQLRNEVIEHINDIASSGFLSASHRNDWFSKVSEEAIEGLRDTFSIPKDYAILYQPSATACMDLTLRNLVMEKSYHFTHGAFSDRFYNSSVQMGLKSYQNSPVWNEPIPYENLEIPDDVELIAATHCETSTGLMWPWDALKTLRKQNPKPLLALDMTSTFGLVPVPWNCLDVVFSSVQKGLSLPPGMAVIILSPRAIEKAEQVNRDKKGATAWQHIPTMLKNMKAYQTVETPNLMAIALLAKIMKSWNFHEKIKQTLYKKDLLYRDHPVLTPYVNDTLWRSSTVACYTVDDPKSLIEQAEEADLLLGGGYGVLKPTCVRVANFSPIKEEDLKELFSVLRLPSPE
jgi:phosphoserine aminotransferase